MLRLTLKRAALLVVALPALALAGCSDSLSGNDTSFAKVNESYKDTLTPQAKKSVISQMTKERVNVQKAAGIEPETTASTTPGKGKKKQTEAKQTEAAQN